MSFLLKVDALKRSFPKISLRRTLNDYEMQRNAGVGLFTRPSPFTLCGWILYRIFNCLCGMYGSRIAQLHMGIGLVHQHANLGTAQDDGLHALAG